MLFSQDLIGKVSASQSFTVTPADVEAFMLATGDPALQQVERDADYVPLTFPTTFRMKIPGLEVDGAQMQLIHGEQEYRYARRLHLGEQLTCTARILDIREKTGRSGTMTILTTEIAGTDSSGAAAFSGISTLLIKPKKREA